jgi:hypothetical protein
MPNKFYDPTYTKDLFTEYIAPDNTLLSQMAHNAQDRSDKYMDKQQEYIKTLLDKELDPAFKDEAVALNQKTQDIIDRMSTSPLFDGNAQAKFNQEILGVANDPTFKNALRTTSELKARDAFLKANPIYNDEEWNMGDAENYKLFKEGKTKEHTFTPVHHRQDLQAKVDTDAKEMTPDELEAISKYGVAGILSTNIIDNSFPLLKQRLMDMRGRYLNDPLVGKQLTRQADHLNHQGNNNTEYDILDDLIHNSAVKYSSYKEKKTVSSDPNAPYLYETAEGKANRKYKEEKEKEESEIQITQTGVNGQNDVQFTPGGYNIVRTTINKNANDLEVPSREIDVNGVKVNISTGKSSFVDISQNMTRVDNALYAKGYRYVPLEVFKNAMNPYKRGITNIDNRYNTKDIEDNTTELIVKDVVEGNEVQQVTRYPKVTGDQIQGIVGENETKPDKDIIYVAIPLGEKEVNVKMPYDNENLSSKHNELYINPKTTKLRAKTPGQRDGAMSKFTTGK